MTGCIGGGVLCALFLGGCATAAPATRADPFAGMVRGVQVVMGTRLSIALSPPGKGDGAQILRRAFEVARGLDALLSNYNSDSALSQLNKQRKARPPNELLRFLRHAKRLCRLTEGAFDIGVGGLLRRARAASPPVFRPAAPCSAYEIVGPLVQLRAGAHLDPGAIGKGYAVDAIVALLRAVGVKRAFIDFGGSSFFGLGAGWQVAVESSQPGRYLGTVLLSNAGLSSSKSLTSSGRPHIVDPRTGKVIEQQRVALAIGPSATETEALSTALIVDPALRPRLDHPFPNAKLIVQQAKNASQGATEALIAPRL